jgi:hypothetical protein
MHIEAVGMRVARPAAGGWQRCEIWRCPTPLHGRPSPRPQRATALHEPIETTPRTLEAGKAARQTSAPQKPLELVLHEARQPGAVTQAIALRAECLIVVAYDLMQHTLRGRPRLVPGRSGHARREARRTPHGGDADRAWFRAIATPNRRCAAAPARFVSTDVRRICVPTPPGPRQRVGYGSGWCQRDPRTRTGWRRLVTRSAQGPG